MNTQIETRNFELAPSLLAHVESELEACIGPYANSVRSVSISLKDDAESEASEGCEATVRVRLKHRMPIKVTTVQGDLYTAVSIGVRRCQRVAERSLRKRRGWHRAAARHFRNSAVSAPL